jgi:hypothetical protein
MENPFKRPSEEPKAPDSQESSSTVSQREKDLDVSLAEEKRALEDIRVASNAYFNDNSLENKTKLDEAEKALADLRRLHMRGIGQPLP